MAVKQILESFQNDGNFSLLDLMDTKIHKKKMRIETFRCSHPDNKFGITEAGSFAKFICGKDHLKSESNRIFRHVFSVEREKEMIITLEIREVFDENGNWLITIRDTDFDSETFGYSMNIYVNETELGYVLIYKIYNTEELASTKIISPVTSLLSNNLKCDISELRNENCIFDHQIKINYNSFEFVNKDFKKIRSFIQKFPTWTKNIKDYQRFGDFRDKCVHDGTNLTGDSVQLASEFILIRAYRASLILTGVAFDNEMYSDFNPLKSKNPLKLDPKPGVYTPFLSAYVLGIKIYQLGIDKVHSDYGGVPMKKSPGSLLENGKKPLVNSYKANVTLARLALAFYQPEILSKKVADKLLLAYN